MSLSLVLYLILFTHSFRFFSCTIFFLWNKPAAQFVSTEAFKSKLKNLLSSDFFR